MSTQKYEALLKIVEIGNITKAAAELGYSQSAISHVVSSLEQEWNVKLLIRDRQGVRLTADGEALIPAIQSVVKENNTLMQQISELQKLERGVIRIGGFPSALHNLIPKLISSFSKSYPQIQFDVRYGGYYGVEQLIHEGRLDCGFVQIPTTVPIESIPLFRDQMYAIFPEGTRPDQTRFPIEDIQQETYIMIKEIDQEVQAILTEHHIKIDKKHFSDYDYSILPMVANGLGMCILPKLILQDQPYKLELKELDPPAYRTIGIGYHRDFLSTATKKFIQHVKEELMVL